MVFMLLLHHLHVIITVLSCSIHACKYLGTNCNDVTTIYMYVCIT